MSQCSEHGTSSGDSVFGDRKERQWGTRSERRVGSCESYACACHVGVLIWAGCKAALPRREMYVCVMPLPLSLVEKKVSVSQ